MRRAERTLDVPRWTPGMLHWGRRKEEGSLETTISVSSQPSPSPHHVSIQTVVQRVVHAHCASYERKSRDAEAPRWIKPWRHKVKRRGDPSID